MKLLLDTSTFLWWLTEPARLSPRVLSLLTDRRNEVALSAVSGWEIALKRRIGRLDLPRDTATLINDAVVDYAITVMPVTMAHAVRGGGLPLHHKDPFDRLLIAQAEIEGLPLASPDPAFAAYGVETIW